MKISQEILKLSEKDDKKLKYDFMPSALEFIERPIFPAGKVIIISLSLLLLTALVWSCFGYIDEVASLRGIIKPIDDIRVIQINENGVVNKINIKDGYFVNENDVLLEMNTEYKQSDLDYINQQITSLEMEIELYNILISNEIIDESKYDINILKLIQSMQKEHQLEISMYEDYSDTISLQLAEQKWETSILQLIRDQSLKLDEAKYQKNNIEKSINEQQIKAPISGYVQDITVSNIGDIVAAGQTLLRIVPQKTEYIVDALAPNQDISYISNEQTVRVKVDTYQYQKYGVEIGKVYYIGHDTNINETGQAMYKVEISLDQTSNENLQLMSGMTVTAEINIGRKRIISYLLDSIIEHIDEGLR